MCCGMLYTRQDICSVRGGLICHKCGNNLHTVFAPTMTPAEKKYDDSISLSTTMSINQPEHIDDYPANWILPE